MIIRNATPSDAPFLAQCILAGMHYYDFVTQPTDEVATILEKLTVCEGREDMLYTYKHSRIAEVDGKAAGSLLAYPGDIYKELKAKTFGYFGPELLERFANDDTETDPGEFYLDSVAVHPDFRKMGIGRALMEDGIQQGRSKGYKKISLVVDPEYPHLVSLYQSIGFTPADRRHAYGTDFLRMIYLL